MADRSFNIDMVFRAHTNDAKSAVNEMGQVFGTASTSTGKSTSSLKDHTVALDKDAAASRKAASEALKLSEAEKRAYENAKKHSGLPVPARPVPSGPTSPPAGQTPANSPFGPQMPRQIEELRAKYVPMFAAQRTYQAEQQAINEAHKRGAISADQQSAAMVRLKKSFDMQVERIERLDPALIGTRRNMKLNAHEAQNLSYQINDVVQSIALGMPMQQVLLQQGPQITQIYGGVGNTFRRLTGLLSVGRIAVTGLTAAVLVGGSAWNGYLKSTKEVATAANGIGAGVAGTAAQMEASARAGAAVAGIGVKSARSLQAQFLQTGKIGAENYEGLIALSKDFGATIGIEAKEVGGALASMFSDPAQAAETLLNKYGLIDAATARQARNLVAQNRATEAQALLIDALPERLANASEAVTGLSRAWTDVKTAAGNALDAMGGAIDKALEGPSIDDRIEAQKNKVRAISKRPFAENYREEFDKAAIELGKLQGEKRRAEKKAEEEDAQRARRAAERPGIVALGIADQSPAVAGAVKREALSNEIAALKAGLDAPGLDDTQRARIATSIEAKSNALGGLIGKQSRLNELARIDIQIQNERNPLLRAELVAQQTRLRLGDQEITLEKASAEAARARLRVISEAMGAARAQASDMQAETAIRANLNGLVAAGALTTEAANRQLQEELRLRPLLAAVALAEGKRKAELQETINALREAYAAQEQQRVRASANEFLRAQRQTIDELRTEISLLGASAEVRAKVLAQMEAEQEIRKLGVGDGAASQIRKGAAEAAKYRLELERVSSAWGSVGKSAETSIDGIVDSLAGGDIPNAIEALATEISGLLLEIGVKNPLKNAILGTNLGTLDDVGGLQGIVDRLTGKTEVEAPTLSAGSVSAGTMIVNAGSVTVNGGLGFGEGTGSASGGYAANTNGVAGSGGLKGKAAVQQQVWDFFTAKGLKPHQVAGIMGNVSAESAFNPMAKGDIINGKPTSFGLFQHHKNRAAGLFNQIGGRGNLGDVQGNLEFAWKELQTTERASFNRLKNAKNVREATSAFVGFERPHGYSVANPENSMHYDRRLGAANDAMTKFTATTAAATQDLGNFGQHADLVGAVLGKVGQAVGGATGTSGSVVTSVLSGIAGAIGFPGFRSGGDTGGSDPSKVAGFVHEQEFVFDALATRRIGVKNLEAIRKGTMAGYRKGGFVSARPAPAGTANTDQAETGGSVVMINNYSGQPATQEETVGSGGKRQTIISIGEQGAAAIGQSGNPMDKQMQRTYGVKRAGPVR